MNNSSPGPSPSTGNTFIYPVSGWKAVTIVALLAVTIVGYTSAAWATEPALSRVTSTEVQTVTFQNRLKASLQSMLDAVVGPGHAVVTVTAELDLDQVETSTKTYVPDPAVAALAESISREAYTGTANGGVLGTGNTTSWYENSRTVRVNAVSQITQARRTAPGTVKRLSVAVLLDSTTAGTVNLAQLQQLLSAAAGIDRARGDSIAVAAAPFDTTAVEQAQQALADSAAAATAAKQQRQFKMIGLALLVLLLLLLAWRASRHARTRKDFSLVEPAHFKTRQAVLEQQELILLTTSIPQAAVKSAPAVDLRRQRAIEHLIEQRPQDVAGLFHGWTTPSR